jgi:hypothetical protein
MGDRLEGHRLFLDHGLRGRFPPLSPGLPDEHRGVFAGAVRKAGPALFRIADFGLRIFLVFFFNPHSAIHIRQFGCPPDSKNEACLMVLGATPLLPGHKIAFWQKQNHKSKDGQAASGLELSLFLR